MVLLNLCNREQTIPNLPRHFMKSLSSEVAPLSKVFYALPCNICSHEMPGTAVSAAIKRPKK
jgi:hypothetical protein